MSDGALPNLVVIGAMKCGTSALHEYLGLHPEVQMSDPKELNFFIGQDDLDPSPYMVEPAEIALFGEYANWRLGPGWYRTQFDARAPVRGESSVAYGYPWYPSTPARMAAVVPDAKLVYIVRDPVERIVSHYQHFRLGGREWRSLPEALASPRNCYLPVSRYGAILGSYLEHFPAERILVVDSARLRAAREETMREVYEFVGVDPGFRDERMAIEWNPTAEVPDEARARSPRQRLADRLRRSERARGVARRLGLGGRGRLTRLAGRERPSLPPALRSALLAELEDDIATVERFTGSDLGAWRASGG